MSVRIINADVMDGLAQLADESVHCVVTSPPYWGLRDYGTVGQIGLEATLGEHIDRMVTVFREVRRALRKDGTLWLNYGDCYATSVNGRSAAETKSIGEDDRTFRDKPFSTVGPIFRTDVANVIQIKNRGVGSKLGAAASSTPQGRVCAGGYIKPKDLCLVSNRLAIALQEDGWWVRSEVVWAKTNPMPDSSGRYRPSVSHEKIWMLSKSANCYYDFAAVMEPITESSAARLSQAIESQEGSDRANAGGKTNGRMKAVRFGGNKGGGEHGSAARTKSGNEWTPEDDLRLMRNVWFVGTQPFKESHFATMPPGIAERCIKSASRPGDTILDPFGGAGTTGLVADRLGRNAILIELSSSFADMARKRITGDCPMFTEVSP